MTLKLADPDGLARVAAIVAAALRRLEATKRNAARPKAALPEVRDSTTTPTQAA
jgi:hypothetical protein